MKKDEGQSKIQEEEQEGAPQERGPGGLNGMGELGREKWWF